MRPKKVVGYLGAPKLRSFVPMEYSHATLIVDVAGKLPRHQIIKKLFLKIYFFQN